MGGLNQLLMSYVFSSGLRDREEGEKGGREVGGIRGMCYIRNT